MTHSKTRSNHFGLAIAGLMLSGLAVSATSQCVNATTVSTTQKDVIEAISTTRDSTQIELAREWGLTHDEWSQYQTVMAGPRGLYSPGLDPLTALGIEATSAEERRRYAELQVKAERQRVDKELAYQHAYDQAFKRMYPDEKIIQLSSSPASPMSSSPSILENESRLALFVQDDCTPCIARVRSLQAQKQAFDLYYVGSRGDDQKIRRWAILAGIDSSSVRNRRITLNHDEGRWQSLGLDGMLPAVVRKVNGQWQRQ